MSKSVIYRGPYGALEIGKKRLVRNGGPVALTAREMEILKRVRRCQYEVDGETEVHEPQPFVPERPPEEVRGAALLRPSEQESGEEDKPWPTSD